MRSTKRPAQTKVEILIAEDSPTQAEQLRYLLDKNGYEVTVTANGNEALAAARERKPALIISDIIMPDIDGYTLCKEVKSQEKLKDIPVMLLTSLSSPIDIVQGLQCGSDNFIRKPYDEKYLLARIGYILATRELRKSEKTQVGMEIEFAGQRHFISSERRQILDLLLSTYEEAVHMNEELEVRQKDLARSYQSLNALYRISEGLNQCNSEQEVAERSLERSLELPDIHAGWFVVRSDEGDFRVVAARGLPAALAGPGMLDGDCLCRRKLLASDLPQATNILECERLQDARGRTRGLRYHASVPIWIGKQLLGIMNLAGREQGMLSDDDLRVLGGVGNQIGIALERARLHEYLEKMVAERTAALRAEINVRKQAEAELEIRGRHNAELYEQTKKQSMDLQRANEELKRREEIQRLLKDLSQDITSMDLTSLLQKLTDKIRVFLTVDISDIRVVEKSGTRIMAASGVGWGTTSRKGRLRNFAENRAPVVIPDLSKSSDAARHRLIRSLGFGGYVGTPFYSRDGQLLGVLRALTYEPRDFQQEEVDLLQQLANGAAIAIENARLYQNLEKSDKVKTEFLSVMSHELRTPLNVIIGYTNLMLDGVLGETKPQVNDGLQKVASQSKDLLS
ncbi:MAG: GAF domain-containing protein, partial [Candidatus Binatia bacterium]